MGAELLEGCSARLRWPGVREHAHRATRSDRWDTRIGLRWAVEYRWGRRAAGEELASDGRVRTAETVALECDVVCVQTERCGLWLRLCGREYLTCDDSIF